MFRLFFILILFIFTYPKITHAQTNAAVSKEVITRIGNPSSPLPDTKEIANDTLFAAAKNIKGAYLSCAQGLTYANAFLPYCLGTALQKYGHPNDYVDAFEIRRRSAHAGGCVQCLGYVAISLTLSSKDTETLKLPSAAAVYNLTSFKAGDKTYVPVRGKNIQPGDVGVAVSGEGIGAAGHILVVKEAKGETKFTAYESNFGTGYPCKATDDQSHNLHFYKFYRPTN